MLYYLAPTVVWVLYCAYWSLKQETPSAALSWIAFLPLIAVVVLRGDVGTDTYRYLSDITSKIQHIDRPFGEYEPGFELLIGVLGALTHNARAVVVAITAINVVLLYTCLKTWGGYWLVGAALTIPAFYFDYTMNALRLGLSLPLCIFAYVAAERSKPAVAVLLICIAASIQMTAPLAFVLLVAYKSPLKLSRRTVIAVTLTLIAIGFLFSAMFTERVIEKYAFYEVTERPSALSGLAPVIISAVLAIPLVTHSQRLRRVSVVFFALQLLLFGFTAFTYAGIRLQLMCLFVHCLIVQRELTPQVYGRRLISAWCVLFFAVCTVWRIHDFAGASEVGDSPYLPYEFVWQSQDIV